MQLLKENADFRKLWAASTVSDFGSQVTVLALPVTAALTLHATAGEMGLLTAAGMAPFLFFSLFAGVWIDRSARRRAILVAADLGRAALLAAIPVAEAFGALRIWELYAIAFLEGVLTVFARIAEFSFVPAI